jgi:hypothetical protein
MPLIDLKTSLKSLKFGKDRPYGGSSNQPYIQSSIPEGDIPTSGGPDFILRGGILAPISAAKDVSRLTQMFFDLKSPNGFQFIAKQNLLSRTSVQTQASSNGGAAYAAGAVNQGVYLPSSTLAQAGVGFTGTHLNLLGIDPSSPMSGITNTSISNLFNEDLTLGLKRYETVVKENPNGFDPSKNRLYDLSIKSSFISPPPPPEEKPSSPTSPTKPNFFQKVGNFLNNVTLNSPQNGILMEYSGGPGSILGVGKTLIPFADQRTGANNPTLKTNGFFADGSQTTYKVFNRLTPNINFVNIIPSKDNLYIEGVSSIYENLTGQKVNNNIDYTSDQRTNTDNFSVYKLGTFDRSFLSKQQTGPFTDNAIYTYDQSQLIKSIPNNAFRKIPFKEDFRRTLIESNELDKNKVSSILSLSPSYVKFNYASRTDAGDPGYTNAGFENQGNVSQVKNVYNYAQASGNGIAEDYKIALDKITAGNIYSAAIAKHNKYKSGDEHAGNDLVKFSIGVVQNNDTGLSNFMHFRAFIDSFSDSYSSDWGSYNYVGRGDKFYNYEGFERTINLSFTVFAQSKAELIPMYKKLNYLASSLAPDYSDSGFMKGNLHKMTIGGYLFDQVGIIKSITYDVPEETPWEIGLDEVGGEDTSVKELPHMIKVTGLTFIPIQDFLPRVATPSNQKNTRYIALAANTNDNDTNYFTPKTVKFTPPTPQTQNEIDEITLQ